MNKLTKKKTKKRKGSKLTYSDKTSMALFFPYKKNVFNYKNCNLSTFCNASSLLIWKGKNNKKISH